MGPSSISGRRDCFRLNKIINITNYHFNSLKSFIKITWLNSVAAHLSKMNLQTEKIWIFFWQDEISDKPGYGSEKYIFKKLNISIFCVEKNRKKPINFLFITSM